MTRGLFSHVDWGLLVPVTVLVFFSLTVLFSINPVFFKNQLFFFLLSLVIFILVTNINYDVIRHYSLGIYVVSIILLLFVLILGIESRGAVRWIEILGIRIQFSEILKPFLAVSFSTFLAGVKQKSFKEFALSGLLLLPVAFLITVQPDLGNAIIYMLVALLTLVIFGFPLVWFVGGGVLAAVCMPFFWKFLHDYQRQRILTFINPTSDPLGTSYNAIQSMIAVGSGGIFGKGIGEGTQSGLLFLPEKHTDFIFATLSESFGLLGGIILFVAFGFLFFRIITIYHNSEDLYYKTFCILAFSLFLVQFFVNIGMNIGIVPVVGVTLPFVSYGGSSILSNFILLGLLSSLSTNLHRRDTLEIR